MTVVLVLSIAEGLGLLREFPVREVPFHPAYFLPLGIASLLLAPAVSRHLPLSGSAQPESTAASQPSFGFGVRVAAIIALGAALLIAIQVLIWLFGSK